MHSLPKPGNSESPAQTENCDSQLAFRNDPTGHTLRIKCDHVAIRGLHWRQVSVNHDRREDLLLLVDSKHSTATIAHYEPAGLV